MIAEALVQLAPNAEWTIDGDSYEGITWYSSGITKPSKSAEKPGRIPNLSVLKKTTYKKLFKFQVS